MCVKLEEQKKERQMQTRRQRRRVAVLSQHQHCVQNQASDDQLSQMALPANLSRETSSVAAVMLQCAVRGWRARADMRIKLVTQPFNSQSRNDVLKTSRSDLLVRLRDTSLEMALDGSKLNTNETTDADRNVNESDGMSTSEAEAAQEAKSMVTELLSSGSELPWCQAASAALPTPHAALAETLSSPAAEETSMVGVAAEASQMQEESRKDDLSPPAVHSIAIDGTSGSSARSN
jgi:hypothetical protein